MGQITFIHQKDVLFDYVCQMYARRKLKPKRAGTFSGTTRGHGGILFHIENNYFIEVEDGAVNIPAYILDENRKYTFAGTNVEILSQILARHGLNIMDTVTDPKAGDFVVCKDAVQDNTHKEISGNIYKIVSSINKSSGGVGCGSGDTIQEKK